MRIAIARFLFVALVTQGCSSDRGTHLELSSMEDTSTRANSMSLEEEDSGGGNEGAGGRVDGLMRIKSHASDPQLARQQSIEHARNAGILGAVGLTQRQWTGAGPAAPVRLDDDGRIVKHDRPTRGAPAAPSAWTVAALDRVSTFAADVDTASYTQGRRSLVDGALPDRASVRVEEYVNYFDYHYAPPPRDQPFAVAMDLAPSPFDRTRQILRVGVSTRALPPVERKQANLVFLVDVSGSMSGSDRLPLAKQSMKILLDHLQDGDTVSIVTYAGSTQLVLPATGLDQRKAINAAIDRLQSGGGTAMGDGISLAYTEAMKGLRPGAFSRVIVLSDGDANIGRTGHDEILATIAGKVKEGVTLSTIGFGAGNYRDETMEQLANKGNGNNYYIDGLAQARRVFGTQLGATLEVVAKDVKLQVDFHPERVTRYRLIGYENRDIADSDFRKDRVDAGEIGAGHQVTAVYEVELAPKAALGTIATVRIRHKAPTGTTATESAYPLPGTAIASSFGAASADFRFAFATAAFADVLRGGRDATDWTLTEIRELAEGAAGRSADRAELIELIDKAIQLRADS